MTGLQVVTLLFLSAGVYCRRLAPLVGDDRSTEVIKGEYIVVLKNGLSAEEVDAHIEYVKEQALMEQQSMDDVYAEGDEGNEIAGSQDNSDDPAATVVPESIGEEQLYGRRYMRLKVSRKHRGNSMPEAIMSTYNEEKFKAYAARMSDSLRDSIRTLKEVKYVERNQVFRAEACVNQSNAPWGLARTVSRNILTFKNYKIYLWDHTGEGVYVYVIDSGINIAHPDFEGRARWGIDFTKSFRRNTDVHGHGTHVAGTIMSKTYGIAKKAIAIDVRVLGDDGKGITATILSGITYAIQQHTPLNKSIINLSVSGKTSNSINILVNQAVEKGIYVVSAAGNEGKDACTRSPASATESITVMASDISDTFYTFSNFGPCAHIIAPGVNVLSTSNTLGSKLKSGTSMAAPHVAGVIAKHIGALPVSSLPSPRTMRTILQTMATADIVNNVALETPNKLLHYPCT